VLKDVQHILGPDANLVLAGNQEDNGLAVASKVSRSRKAQSQSRAQSIIHPGYLNPAASPRYSPVRSSPLKPSSKSYGSPQVFDPAMFNSSLPVGFLSAFGNLKV